jgi:hypothetical protein
MAPSPAAGSQMNLGRYVDSMNNRLETASGGLKYASRPLAAWWWLL